MWGEGLVLRNQGRQRAGNLLGLCCGAEGGWELGVLNPAWLRKSGIFGKLVLPTLAAFRERMGPVVLSGGRVEFGICEVWCWDWGGSY